MNSGQVLDMLAGIANDIEDGDGFDIEKWKEYADKRDTDDEICDNICRWRVRAFETNKDPDDAERWLDMNYCSCGCPIYRT